jgi:hypothetical protein
MKRRPGVEVKRRRSREDIPSQVDESGKPHHLEIYPSKLLKPSLRIFLSYFTKCLTLLNNLGKPHQSLSP